MQNLWTSPELSQALGTASSREATDVSVSGVSIDTRTLAGGDLFVALKDLRDGHEFVTSAFKAGASAALVSDAYAKQAGDGPLFRVPDVLKGLEALGVAARVRLAGEARVVAVTGSAGKTGTKEMLRACFSILGPTHASEKSYNNHWGVPLTLARMPRDTRFAVFEIGMNHAGEIRPLTAMVRPHAAIVTTVEAVHLEHFSSVEGIADAKGEIFEGIVPGGAAIIKHDNPFRERLVGIAKNCGARSVTFGFGADADVRGEDLTLSDAGTTMTVSTSGRRLRVTLGMPGRHIAENALAVVAALDAVGADIERAIAALAELKPPVGRGERTILAVRGEEALLIDESYNANPASMRAALATLAAQPRDKFARRIGVLGDMLELGPDAAELHRSLKDAVEEAGIDLIFACGVHMKGLYDALPESKKGGYGLTPGILTEGLLEILRPGDVVMVKASNGTRLGEVVSGLKSHFSRRGSAA
ncbi:UDP-N-acetylmuramoylalanyl-D-glutamyl-2,6-diaminopimelate--D-alanyl-D-alanine ligase [Hyphomicrobium methylovorum]|uniref:UDP-N-acetylmuramoylalanyl-D-glutamyl-2, 6-diaminopimelate--D-alanyl-D-alanine ligase n=1 Tax=Hyphomicrobium methylovorum TaxID=84 RepID=UPI0015E7295D|nr:UDP-N-acetylmuramoylalanyl-D-glutamyl-2,6-diaminopimelate--D-alanyl-D-alanine ligase [Hyphomicrobium methylovorum]MBA2126556.1 UDP-N-acetylmuramoylalanyl-D-glutamyl-2,6-diaminopimelate--D-alanyl-D-alanine ligase [Hyphomicrobium methylovorum]